MVYGVFMQASFYTAFMTGLYQWRSFEYSMRQCPFPIKFGVSLILPVSACWMLKNKQVYNPDLYEMALKYREHYDGEGLEREKDFVRYI